MLYAILCYDNENITVNWPKEKEAEVMKNLGAVQADLARQGRLGPVAKLMPTTAATTLRKKQEPLVIDGPFAETKEQLLGFYVVECASLDEALATAKDLSRANPSDGAYEIRPIELFNPVPPTL